MHKMQQPNTATKDNSTCQQSDSGITMKSRFVRHAILASMTMVIAACGDSDLPALQRDAIIEAQQRDVAAHQASQADQSLPESGEATTPLVPVTPETPETPDTTEADGSDEATTEQEVELGAAVEDTSEPPNTIDFDDFQLVFNENFDDGTIDPENGPPPFVGDRILLLTMKSSTTLISRIHPTSVTTRFVWIQAAWLSVQT